MPEAEAVFNAALRADFPLFLRKVFQTVSPGGPLAWNWHLDAICYVLDGVWSGATKRLVVTIPPRHLKSIAISVAWVAFQLGHNPQLRFVCVSYSQELALKHARDCRAVMETEWYKRIFPHTRLSRTRNAEHDFETTARGGRFSTSSGGTLTGRGGDHIVIDDPIKPDDATSETVRKSVLTWFSNTLLSRLNDKTTGTILLVMQRLHEEDLAGHLLESGDWQHLCLPAIAVEAETIPIGRGRVHHRRPGDVLHPERESRALLEATKAMVGSLVFSAQYQQAPVPLEGNLVRRDWLRRYPFPMTRQPGDTIVQSWDTASKDGVMNDYSVCLTALIRGRDVYLIDVYRAKLNFPDLVKQVARLATRFRTTALLIEDAASGTQIIQRLRAQRLRDVPRPIAMKPTQDKLTRMYAQTARIEAGEFFLPDKAPWLAAFEHELLAFPNGRHDDQVDALAQLLCWRGRRWRRGVGAPSAG